MDPTAREVGDFLAAATMVGASLEVSAGDLYAAYCRWCGTRPATPMSGFSFTQQIGARYAMRKAERIYWQGLSLLAVAASEGVEVRA